MVDVLGPFLLVVFTVNGDGVEIQKMRDMQSCKAAVTQLDVYSNKIHAMCIAATVG